MAAMVDRHGTIMEADGLVTRTAYAEIPPRVECSLTPLGESLNQALIPLGDWGDEHMDGIAGCRRERPGHL